MTEESNEAAPLDVNRIFMAILKQFGPFECSAEEFTSNYIADFEEEQVFINFSDDLESITIGLASELPDDIN